MSDEPLISTHEKASSPDSISPEKKEEKRKNEKQTTSKKRKINETVYERPNTLETAKRIKIRRKSSSQPSTSTEPAAAPISSKYTEDDSDDEEDYRNIHIPRRRIFSDKNQSDREPSMTESDPMKVWTAADDMALITAVSHVSCIRFVHNTLIFSRKFTFSDLEERFCQLMYDEKMSQQAKERMAKMSFRQILQIQSRTPFTRIEEKCLSQSTEAILVKFVEARKCEKETSHTMLRISHFKTILEENRQIFHVARTPQVLSDHFRRMKWYNERPEESMFNYEALELPADGIVDNFDFLGPLQECRTRFHTISRKPALRGILNRFQTSASVPDNAIAMIRGQFLSFAMTTPEAVMGRAANNQKVDIDLSIEGPAYKVSRQQAVIRQSLEGDFNIQNIGQRPIYVDCKPLSQMVSTSLKHGSIIEVASIRLIFTIPVPRVLHPLTKLGVQAQRRQLDATKSTYQQYQKQTSSTNKKARQTAGRSLSGSPGSPVGSGSRVPMEQDRLLQTIDRS